MEFRLDDAVAVLGRTPSTLGSLLGELPDVWSRSTCGGDTWSAYDVVGHLIDGEEADWIPRARIILAQGPSPKFELFDRTRHLGRGQESMGHRLARFEHLRSENLAALEAFGLTSRHLALTGIHPEFGRVTLAQHLATWVAHDLSHTAQIVRTMARQYSGAVGPWRAYLRVLQE